jgi:hypothetical protein
MEDLIKVFMSVQPLTSGSGYGYGSGSGYGDGSGYGYGDGDGDGYGYGDGSGYGDGDGSGYGDGSGSGYGYGDGSGYGYGDGSGYGYGDGDGDGSGYGYGDGDGDGSGYGDGDGDVKTIDIAEYRKGFISKQIASFKSYKGKPVYYIDEIPCTFLSIVNNLAKVEVIKDDYNAQKMYIAKSGSLFAHGETKEEAIQSVHDKYFASLSFDERKAEFIKTFKKDQAYSNKLFFDWHYLLTGSCESGRMMFVKSRNIDLNSEMTAYDFLNLTKNEYNGEVIRDILEQIN